MAQKKGQTGNPNGRPKGSPNKVTTNLREWINKFLEDNTEGIQRDWKKLTPRDRITLFEKLLKYAVPVLQATTIMTDFDRLPDDQLKEMIEKIKTEHNESRNKKRND